MNCKSVTLLALIAILFGSAIVQASAGSGIQLRVFDSSNAWWVAVDAVNDDDQTMKIEIQQASSSKWIEMAPNDAWGYWQLASSSSNGFSFPLSFRLTSKGGDVVSIGNAMDAITPGAVLNTQAAYGQNTQAPTTRPTTRPTQAPTTRPTQAPTTRPTQAPTTRPTQAPTTRPTQAPTTRPTQAPTQRPTVLPTTKPTTKPTSSGSGSTDLCTVPPTSEEPLIFLVPLYVDPGSDWDSVIDAAATGTPIIAIINPNDGPTANGPDSSYKSYMKKFADAGITMVGYVYSGYGTRNIATVKAEIDTYATKFPGIVGIFVDEASADASDIPYYKQLYDHIMSKPGFVHDIVNPGAQPAAGYLDVSTTLVIFESPAAQLKTSYASWVKCAPSASEKAGYKYKFSGISYGTAANNVASILSNFNQLGMGMVYVTQSADECCVYNNLPSYFAAEAAAINALN